jgi:hypothetical protein
MMAAPSPRTCAKLPLLSAGRGRNLLRTPARGRGRVRVAAPLGLFMPAHGAKQNCPGVTIKVESLPHRTRGGRGCPGCVFPLNLPVETWRAAHAARPFFQQVTWAAQAFCERISGTGTGTGRMNNWETQQKPISKIGCLSAIQGALA